MKPNLLQSLREALDEIHDQRYQPFEYQPNAADLAPDSFWRRAGCPGVPKGKYDL